MPVENLKSLIVHDVENRRFIVADLPHDDDSQLTAYRINYEPFTIIQVIDFEETMIVNPSGSMYVEHEKNLA